MGMKFRLGRARGFSRVGQRDHQEDTMYPQEENLASGGNIYLVCDGMGGHSCGEVASGIICNYLAEHAETVLKNRTDKKIFENLLMDAWDEMERHEASDGSQGRMGTTMTFAGFTPEGLMVSHLGDSIIYVIRPGVRTQFLYRSADHTPLYPRVRDRIITEFEALSISGRNRIDMAVIAGRRFEPETQIITDLQAGDYVMLCSDGVTENLTDDMIRFIFSYFKDADSICQALLEHCMHSQDNHSCIIVPIEEVGEEEVNDMSYESITEPCPKEKVETPEVPKPDEDETPVPIIENEEHQELSDNLSEQPVEEATVVNEELWENFTEHNEGTDQDVLVEMSRGKYSEEGWFSSGDDELLKACKQNEWK